MDKSAEFIRFLKNIMARASSFPLFLVTDATASFQVEVPKEAIGGNPDGPEIVFQQGRALAQQHRHLCRNTHLHVMQITPGRSSEGEVVIVSILDQKTGKIVAIPYQVVRDRKGQFTDLIDTGGFAQVAGAFLPAFLLGINTSDQLEQQALQGLKREMTRLAKRRRDA
jgi:hypothetical protein